MSAGAHSSAPCRLRRSRAGPLSVRFQTASAEMSSTLQGGAFGRSLARPVVRPTATQRRAAEVATTSAPDEERKRNVAIFVEPSPFSHISGMKNRFECLIRNLRDQGDDVIVFTPDRSPPRHFHGARVRPCLHTARAGTPPPMAPQPRARVRCAGGQRARLQAAFLPGAHAPALARPLRARALVPTKQAPRCDPRLQPRPARVQRRPVRQAALDPACRVVPHPHPRVHPPLHLERPRRAHVEHHPLVHAHVGPHARHE